MIKKERTRRTCTARVASAISSRLRSRWPLYERQRPVAKFQLRRKAEEKKQTQLRERKIVADGE